MDTDRTGTLSVTDILGTKGELISTTAKIVAEEIQQEPEPEIQTPEPEVIEPVEKVETQEIISEELVSENDTIIENESASIFDSADISSQLSQARFSSEKTKIIESMKGNPVEFDITINRIRTEAGPNRPMEVEVSASDGSDYIISIDTSKISSIPQFFPIWSEPVQASARPVQEEKS